MTLQDFARQLGYTTTEDEGGRNTWFNGEQRLGVEGASDDPLANLGEWYQRFSGDKDAQGRQIWGTEAFEKPGGPGSTFQGPNGESRYRLGADNLDAKYRAVGGTDADLTYDEKTGYSIPMALQDEWAKKWQKDSMLEKVANNMPVILGSILTGGAATAAAGGAAGGLTASTIGGAVGGATYGGFNTGSFDAKGAAIGAATGAAGGAAKNLIGGFLTESGLSLKDMGIDTASFFDNPSFQNVSMDASDLGSSISPEDIASLNEMADTFGAGATTTSGISPSDIAGLDSAVNEYNGYGTPSTTNDYGVNSGGNSLGGNYSYGVEPTGSGVFNAAGAAAGGGIISEALKFVKENPMASSIGASLVGGLIQGAMAPGAAKAKAEAEAEALQQLEDHRRTATSLNGVNFNVTPTGKMLRTPMQLDRRLR